jgi:hypothetical protein
MTLGGRSSISVNETVCHRARIRNVHAQLKKNRYASPGGGSRIYIELTNHWTNNPVIGVLNGQSLAKNDEYGRIPSRPSSWVSRPWVNKADRLFPQVDIAITRLSSCGHWSSVVRTGDIFQQHTLSVPGPNIFRKKSALGSRAVLMLRRGQKKGLDSPNDATAAQDVVL